MKRISKVERNASGVSDLAAEYTFDYSKAKPNRFAERARPGSIAVVLDPDVARVFKDARSVNTALRALMEKIPRSHDD